MGATLTEIRILEGNVIRSLVTHEVLPGLELGLWLSAGPGVLRPQRAAALREPSLTEAL